jgi:putative N6-adenine-specific DNA methylase
VRRRLITPASEAPAPRQPAVEPRPPVADTPAAAPAPQVIAAQPIAPPPTAAPTVRRRLITPISEIPEPAAPAPAARSEIAAPPAAPATEQTVARIAPRPPRRPITPNIHAPDPRRGLPANDRMPTEHPVFERRSATPRLRGEAPQALAMFASCPRGLEPILTQELQRMQAGDIAPVDGGVGFNGALELLMRVNLESRVASRVLLRLAQGPYQNERDVNALAMQIDWPAQFDVSRTIKVKTDGVGAQVKSLDFVSLTVKDAICDRFRQAQLGRPNVDTREPDARIQVFLSPREASIYLDSSGEPLFKRGWRKETGEAPLRENLAAGILLLSGYNGEQPLIDPMCGSGTFLVEAGDIALNRAPGRNREFAFQKWRNFDPSAWEQLKLQAKQAERQVDALPIHGSDNDAKMVSISRANLERADLAGLIQVQKQELFDVRPEAASGLIVTNPPYGVRMDEQSALAELYPQIGDWLKQYFAGWTANLFSGDMNLAKLIRLSVKRRIPLYNGSLDCRIFVLRLIAGSARAEKP